MKEVPAQVKPLDRFGSSVAVFNNTFIVGARILRTVYVYERNSSHQLSTPKKIVLDKPVEYVHSVATNGEVIVIGVPYKIFPGAGQLGAAYIYKRVGSEWVVSQDPLRAPNGTGRVGDRFGHSVGVYGNYIVVGSPEHDIDGHLSSRIGAVYIFKKNGSVWSWKKTLEPNVCLDFCRPRFGSSVAIFNDTIVVGAPFYDIVDPKIGNAGAVYIYERNGDKWIPLDNPLTAPNANNGDEFGSSVGLYEDTVIVGSPQFDDRYYNVFGIGTAYIFTRVGANKWEIEEQIVPRARAGAKVGSSVAIYGNTAVIGTMKG